MVTPINPSTIIQALAPQIAIPIQDPGLTSGVGAVGGTTAPASSSQFGQALTNAIGNLSDLQNSSDKAMASVATNGGTDVSTAMIAMEQASLGMHMATTVRNKAVEAYQTLMNMQM